MPERVILDEGGSVSVHTRIKDMCKAARNRLGYTNQDICFKISERFGIDDFSVNTVNNFFSERSKATTIYTTGYICAVLGISIDAVFGIEGENSGAEGSELLRQLSALEIRLREEEHNVEYLEKMISEKDERLSQAHRALEHYRKEAEANRKKVQPWVLLTAIILLAATITFICVYIFIYDVRNPDYGMFRQGACTAQDLAAGLIHALPGRY